MTADIALLLGRTLLSTVFIGSALDKLRGSPVEEAAIESLHLPAPRFLERLSGACEVIGSAMLIFGIGARLASILFALFLAFVSRTLPSILEAPSAEAKATKMQ